MEEPRIAERKGLRGFRLALVLIAVAVLSVTATAFYFANRYGSLITVGEAVGLVSQNYYYYEDLDDDQLLTGALRGIADNLGDKYAAYYTEEEYATLLESNSGNYVGMGVLVTMQEDGGFYITSVFENTPASEAGLLSGDRILWINDADAAAYTDLSAFLDNVSREVGDVNTLVVLRDGEEQTFSVSMREVYSPYVEHRMLDADIGYIRIKGFQGKCVEEVKAALEDLDAQGMTGLVLDVRDNLGGLLTDVNSIAEYFLPKGSVITTVRSRSAEEVVYRTNADGRDKDVPIVMLVNGYSASASELLAGALHDNGAAVLVGTTTYGKGIVQSYFHINGNYGYLKMTTDAYYTPSGVCIQDAGLAPDIEVKLSEELMNQDVSLLTAEEDVQLAAAIAYLIDLI